jgi:hypothetical protein
MDPGALRLPKGDRELLGYFCIYFVSTLALFLFLPSLLGKPYLVPWDYSWAFLVITPPFAEAILGLYVLKGRFSGLSVGIFFMAAVLLGFFLLWLSLELSAVV